MAKAPGDVDEIRSAEWFHGEITREQAEFRLRNSPPGEFLVRKSETREGYSLSQMSKGKVKHFIVSSPNGHYKLVGKPFTFPTMAELVLFFGSTPTSTTDGVTLTKPSPVPTDPEHQEAEAAYVSLLDSGVNEKVMAEVQQLAQRKASSKSMEG
eukprot:m.281212 g.281212  ORF g.281212 m.281212 type:complete len:154 (-) comp19402_c1_seq7:243-704(-)